MAKWKLPEGRKPFTDADMAALMRRLADTAIEQSEIYLAAKRDAEEAEAYAKELEVKMIWADEISNIQAARLEELEAKLAKSTEALQRISLGSWTPWTK